MDGQNCIYLGIKVKPGPVERCKLDNFGLNNTVGKLRDEAGKKANIPSASLELVHHGKILKDEQTLQDSGIKNGEMIHVVKKKVEPAPEAPPSFSDAELQQIITALRTFGCTPNAPGWTRAMQVLNDEAGLSEITEAVPSLNDDCVTMSILHEVELLAALGASVHTMRRAADARPALPMALRRLTRMVRANPGAPQNSTSAPTSGFAYSLEALSEDDDGEDDEPDEPAVSTITQEQVAAALAAVTSGTSAQTSNTNDTGLIRMLQRRLTSNTGQSSSASGSTPLITPEMFSSAIANAMSNFNANTAADDNAVDSMDVAPSSANQPAAAPADNSEGNYVTQIRHMHEMGLTDDTLNVRALLMCGGDANSAINLILSGAIADE